MISQNNIMSIIEAKNRVEADMYNSDGSISNIKLIKLVREVYAEGYKVGQYDATNNVGQPTQLDRIEATLKELADAILGES